MLAKTEYLALLDADSAALIAAAEDHLDLPVPSCPGWRVIDLVVHTGVVHRAWAQVVATRATEASEIKREALFPVPGLLEWFENSVLSGKQSDLTSIPPGVGGWFRDGSADLVHALSEADPADVVWSWSSDKSVTHHLRMMPIETALHRWDAEGAVGVPEPIAANLAADGIGHTFEVMAPYRRSIRPVARGEGQTYKWIADGTGESWTTRFEGDEITVTRGDEAAADVVVRGSASDLLLFLWHRVPSSHLTVTGDQSVLDSYFSLVPPI